MVEFARFAAFFNHRFRRFKNRVNELSARGRTLHLKHDQDTERATFNGNLMRVRGVVSEIRQSDLTPLDASAMQMYEEALTQIRSASWRSRTAIEDFEAYIGVRRGVVTEHVQDELVLQTIVGRSIEGLETCLEAVEVFDRFFNFLNNRFRRFKMTVNEWVGNHSAEEWHQLGSSINGDSMGDHFGTSVAFSADGGRLIASATQFHRPGRAGYARVYELRNGVWEQLGEDIHGAPEYDDFGQAVPAEFGFSVAISSDGVRVAIGVPGSSSGRVRMYEFRDQAWVQLGSDIEGEHYGDWFGCSVSLSGDGSRVGIGARDSDGPDGGEFNGQVRVYHWDGLSWTQLGGDIDGEGFEDALGWSVVLSESGNRLIAGAYPNHGDGGYGYARVYELRSATWEQLGGDLAAPEGGAYSVSISSDGRRVAVATLRDPEARMEVGPVRIYEFQDHAWAQLGGDIERNEIFFGWSISLSADGSRVAIGAPAGNGVYAEYSGHVRVFAFNASDWIQLGDSIDGEATSDFFGNSVSLSADGNRLSIGGPGRVSSKSGQVRIFELA